MEDSREKIIGICAEALAKRSLNSQEFRDRLKTEIKEIDNQAEHDYFLELYEQKARFTKNENNLLVSYLLGLTDEFDISSEPAHIQGEFPDIDVDYIPAIQEYIRKDWCPKTFGRDKVVNIGNYGTFGIKSALLDMARVHSADYTEIQTITKNLQDRDDEGKPLTWEKALETAPELSAYCERNPEIADSARRLIDRNRGRGKHAGGTVISSIKIDDLVPVMIDTDGNPVSGWTEGLHDQDLQPVGLIKFDVLAVKDLLRIAYCCHIVKQRHPEVKGISAASGHSDWTDTSYLNDPKALEIANRAETRGVFQFDGEGMRKLIKAGGVDRFEDLVAYSSLFRPAALGLKMHERYVERKKGRERWKDQVPECLTEILASTYGILIYQESVMRVLNVVGDIPLIHCEKIRKAISKKKTSEFLKYKQIFLENGSKKTGWPIESDDERNMNFLWTQLENFSSYGFNKTLTEDTYILSDSGLKQIRDFRAGDKVFCIDEFGERKETDVLNVHDHGVMNVHRVYFDDGYFVDCTLDHKFLTDGGQVPLWKIIKNDLSILCSPFEGEQYASSDRDQIRMWQDFQIREESQKTLPKMQVMCQGEAEEETRFNEKHSKVRGEALDYKEPYGSQKTMQEMSAHGLEGFGLPSCFKMWKRVSDERDIIFTSKILQEMRLNQKRKHSIEDGETEQRQSRPGEEGYFLGNSKKDIGEKRHTTQEGREAQTVEGREPGEVQKNNSIGDEVTKEVQDGILASGRFGLEESVCKVWRRSEICGYGKGANLDRSRRMFSFLGDQEKIQQEAAQFQASSGEGQHAQGGGVEEEEHYADKVEYVVLLQTGSHERGMAQSVARHAPISETGGLLRRRVLRAVPVGRRQCYDLEVACSTHNFILPNGVVTSNSHAVAYTHTSSRLLYLKAHYPLEFFCSTLGLEGDEDKVKMYKREAERSGIKINRCDLNKSKVNYEIVGDEIYVGFSNIKGVGKEAAEKIVALQPFSGLPDFLNRFGTDKRIVEPLICLGAFKDAAPNVLLEFYEEYKKWSKGNLDKEKRQMKRRDDLAQSIRSMLREGFEHHAEHDAIMRIFEDGKVSSMRDAISEEFGAADYLALVKKYAKSVLDFDHKIKFSKDNSISLENWKPSNRYPPDKWPNIFELERKYYGFSWEHPIQKSADYVGGHSFNIFKDDDTIVNAGVEVMITKKPQEKVSKNGNKYYYALVEDEDWNVEVVTFWSEDYARFKEDLEYWNEEQNRGHFLRIRLKSPGSGFKSYTFESPPKAIRYKVIPSDKKLDMRLQIMQSPM